MVVLLTVDPDQLTDVYEGDNYFGFVGVTDAEVDIRERSNITAHLEEPRGLS